MEELFIELDELEEVEKMLRSNIFAFPAMHVGDGQCTFNRFCAPLLGEYVQWFTTPEYVIGLPAKKGERNAFKVQGTIVTGRCINTTFPIVLKTEKKIMSGYYKIYKYKNGFAFKRYEQLDPKTV